MRMQVKGFTMILAHMQTGELENKVVGIESMETTNGRNIGAQYSLT